MKELANTQIEYIFATESLQRRERDNHLLIDDIHKPRWQYMRLTSIYPIANRKSPPPKKNICRYLEDFNPGITQTIN